MQSQMSQFPSMKNPDSKQTIYAYEKNRTDAKQMPLNFFYSQKAPNRETEDNSESLAGQFKHSFQDYGRDTDVKNFFSEITYVGCFGLRYILIHQENKLHMLDIIEFLPSFLIPFSVSNAFPLKKVSEPFCVSQIIRDFNKKTQLLKQEE